MTDSAKKAALAQGIRLVWEKTRDIVVARIETLEAAAHKIMEGTLTAEEREAAVREAHKLAGSLGTFGFTAGSNAARELEQQLSAEVPDAARCAELARLIRQSIGTSS